MPPVRKAADADIRVPEPELQLYANSLTVNGGAYDVSLDFGYAVAGPRPKPVVRVTMSYEHMASMVRLLTTLLDQYTEVAGQLPEPDMAALEARADA